MNHPKNIAVFSYQDYLLNALKTCSTELNLYPKYWTILSKSMDQKVKNIYPECITHDHFDAIFGKPPIELDKEPVCDPTILDKISIYEADALTMLSRHELYDGCFTLSERRKLFKKVAGIWHHLIQKHNIEAMIFEEEPHTFSDYVVYCIAKVLKIDTYFFSRTSEGDHLVVFKSINQKSQMFEIDIFSPEEIQKRRNELNKMWLILKGDYNKVEKFHLYSQQEILGDKNFLKSIKKGTIFSTKFLNSIIIRSIKYTLMNRKKNKRFIRSGVSNFRALKNGNFEEVSYPRFLIHKLFSILKASFLKLIYEIICDKDFLEEQYIFLPLHMQPEKTTMPMGGIYDDQEYLVKLLLDCLPKNIKLIIKEHKSQYVNKFIRWGFRYRSLNLYLKWYKNPRIKLASMKHDTYRLIDNSLAVATITGTVGLECIARNKPVLLFGSPWYRDHKSLIKIESKNQLKKTINELIENKLKKYNYNFEQDSLQFLAKLSKNSFKGFAGGHGHNQYLNFKGKENELVYQKVLKFIFKEV